MVSNDLRLLLALENMSNLNDALTSVTYAVGLNTLATIPSEVRYRFLADRYLYLRLL